MRCKKGYEIGRVRLQLEKIGFSMKNRISGFANDKLAKINNPQERRKRIQLPIYVPRIIQTFDLFLSIRLELVFQWQKLSGELCPTYCSLFLAVFGACHQIGGLFS